MNPKLWDELSVWKCAWPSLYKREPEKNDYVFPGHRDISKHLTRRCVGYALRAACKKLGLDGVSTHSFRRSALSAASDKGVGPRPAWHIAMHGDSNVVLRRPTGSKCLNML